MVQQFQYEALNIPCKHAETPKIKAIKVTIHVFFHIHHLFKLTKPLTTGQTLLPGFINSCQAPVPSDASRAEQQVGE